MAEWQLLWQRLRLKEMLRGETDAKAEGSATTEGPSPGTRPLGAPVGGRPGTPPGAPGAPKSHFGAQSRLLGRKPTFERKSEKSADFSPKVRKVRIFMKITKNSTFCSKMRNLLPKPSIFLVLEQHFRKGREKSEKCWF